MNVGNNLVSPPIETAHLRLILGPIHNHTISQVIYTVAVERTFSNVFVLDKTIDFFDRISVEDNYTRTQNS